MNLFRAPAAARAIKTLDRALFARTLPAAAASIKENKTISNIRKQLEKTNELLSLERFDSIVSDPDAALAAQGKKCLILKPTIKAEGKKCNVSVSFQSITNRMVDPTTWSQPLRDASQSGDLKVIPYEIAVGYELWSYRKPHQPLTIFLSQLTHPSQSM